MGLSGRRVSREKSGYEKMGKRVVYMNVNKRVVYMNVGRCVVYMNVGKCVVTFVGVAQALVHPP